MKTLTEYSCAILLFLLSNVFQGSCGDRLSVLFWNVENFFDWRADSTSASSSDKEFSSFGTRHWTRRKFVAKSATIAKTILWTADRDGRLPDVIGFAEVENSFVVRQLLNHTVLRRLDYSCIHFESPDPRGIDVALLYRKSTLTPISAVPLHIRDTVGNVLPTRDILLAAFLDGKSDTLAFLVNHHPSKYGSDSQWKRDAALERLRAATDSLQEAGVHDIICMGDFNDTPDNPSFRILTEPAVRGGGEALNDLALPLHDRGEGTIRYNGKWDLIDLFFLSKGLCRRADSRMSILHVPFLTVRDTMYGGEKPYRTYSGPRYIGGVSDHCPILLSLQWK